MLLQIQIVIEILGILFSEKSVQNRQTILISNLMENINDFHFSIQETLANELFSKINE
jgi:hypothetical protein